MFEYIKQFGITGTAMTNNTGLKSPMGVAIDSSGNIYIADTSNQRVVKLNSSMSYVSQFGTTGTSKADNTGLNNPRGVALDSSGNIYITDSYNHRLVKLKSNMQFITYFGLMGLAKSDNTGLNYPYFVTVDHNNNIYVTDQGHRLVKLNSSMQYVSQFGVSGTTKTDNTGFNYPTGVAVDSNNNIYVSDTNNHRLVKLSSSMQYLSQFGTTGTIKAYNTGFYGPYGVTTDSNNNIYIADRNNHRLIKLKKIIFEIICNILQYINSASILDISFSQRVLVLKILVNSIYKLSITPISLNSYKYNLDKVWNELTSGVVSSITIETDRGNKSLSLTKSNPQTSLYNNVFPNKDVLLDYTINPNYDSSNTVLSYTYKISLDGELLFIQGEATNLITQSSITIPYNKLVKGNYKNITDRNIVIEKTNTLTSEVINYNLPIRIDPRKLFSKYFNGVNSYITIQGWTKPLSELVIQVVKKKSTDTDFTVITDNTLVSLTNAVLKIGGISTFTGNIYEVRMWELGKEKPYTYDQLLGNEDGLYALYRLNEYNSNNVYDSGINKLNGIYTGTLNNQETIPVDGNYLTTVDIDIVNSDIVNQHEDYNEKYNISSNGVSYRTIEISSNEISLPLENLSILQNLYIER